MDYIEICEWEKFQHYKKRNPPWVKLYAKVLDDDDFDCLPDDSKLLFFCLLPFASRRNNKIKLNYKWLQKKLPIDKTITKKTLQPLIDAKFIACKQDDSEVIANGEQDATPETETETEQRQRQRQKYSPNSDEVRLSQLLLDFDLARKLFLGAKRGNQTEFDNFVKKHKDWRDILPLLKPAVEQQIKWRAEDGRYWKNFQTWINNRCWEEEKSKDTQNGKRQQPKNRDFGGASTGTQIIHA